MKRQSKVQALAAVALVTGATLGAQATTQAPTGLRVTGGVTAGKSLVVTADKPAYFALFAVGRGTTGNPVQVLTPAEAAQLGLRTPARRTAAQPLSPVALGRFAASDEMVVVALAANSQASLDAFMANGHPAGDLALPDSIVADGQRLIATLAASVFGPEVQYTGRLLPIEPRTIPLPQNVAMNHCGEAANPPAGGYAFSAASSPEPVDIAGVGPRKSINDDSYGSVSVVRLPGCSAVVYRMMPLPTPLQRPAPAPGTTAPPSVPK